MMKVFLLQPQMDFDSEGALPPHGETLVQDLGLEMIFSTMAGEDKFVKDVVKRVILTGSTDPQVIQYRQAILRDCLDHPEHTRRLYQIPLEFLDRKRKQWLWFSPRHSSPVLILSGARQLLESSLDLLRALRALAAEMAERFESEGWRRFCGMVLRELDDTYLDLVDSHVKTLRFPDGVLLSARLGRGNEGTDYLVRSPLPSRHDWVSRIFSKQSPTYSFSLHPRDESGARILSDLRDRGLARAADSVARAAEHIESFFQRLRWELAFYIGCLNLKERLERTRFPYCFPLPAPLQDYRLEATGLYDISLALSLGERIVGNEFNGNRKNLLLITGPNKGGKTTFLRSIGQAQLLMQAGMFVPAQAFSANLSSGLFTHFLREEDKSMERGKFEEELQRMDGIIEQVRPHGLVLMNESFSATNEREGSEIALQVVKALLESKVKVAYVTHLSEFVLRLMADSIPESAPGGISPPASLSSPLSFQQGSRPLHSNTDDPIHRHSSLPGDPATLHPLFLVAERLADGTRTYKIKEGIPPLNSYSEDLYQRVFSEGSATRG